MKKLMIGAVAVALTTGAFASCDDNSADCVAWDLTMSLKSLDAKKLSCKDSCGDKGTVYYLDNGTRKLKGYVWVCGDPCNDDPVYIVLWDTKKKIPVIAAPRDRGNYADLAVLAVNWGEFIIYGKKGNKVAGSFDIVDPDGENINVKASGLNGSLKLGCSDCYVKSLSGQAAGDIAVGKTYNVVSVDAGGLCGDKVVETCDDPVDVTIYYLTLCDVCCGFEGWCNEIANDQGDIKDVETDLGGMVPAYGSWKMKYNKKMSKDSNTKSIWDYIPTYAL